VITIATRHCSKNERRVYSLHARDKETECRKASVQVSTNDDQNRTQLSTCSRETTTDRHGRLAAHTAIRHEEVDDRARSDIHQIGRLSGSNGSAVPKFGGSVPRRRTPARRHFPMCEIHCGQPVD